MCVSTHRPRRGRYIGTNVLNYIGNTNNRVKVLYTKSGAGSNSSPDFVLIYFYISDSSLDASHSDMVSSGTRLKMYLPRKASGDITGEKTSP